MESVAAPLVYADARNVEVLTDLQPVNAVRDLPVLARLLDAWTDVGVPQCDAVFVAASGIDNLPGRDGTVRVDPVAPPPTVSSNFVMGLDGLRSGSLKAMLVAKKFQGAGKIVG